MSGRNGAETCLATNRRAFHDYAIQERIEAGIELRGTEVKSAKSARVSLAGAYALIEEGEAIVYHLHIPAYEFGNRFNHDPLRPRRLLLHKREIYRLQGLTQQRGHTLVPLRVYLRRGRIKIELGLCRGRRLTDRREALRRETAEREARRAMRRQR